MHIYIYIYTHIHIHVTVLIRSWTQVMTLPPGRRKTVPLNNSSNSITIYYLYSRV